jgi:glycerol-3-phosphate dehydrogenase
VNAAYPPARLKRADVSFHYGGLLPMDGYDEQTGTVSLLKSYQIVDHAVEGGLKGLLSVVSVKYTTARDVAEKTIEYAVKKLGRKFKKVKRFTTPVFGGEISDFKKYLEKEKARGYGDLGPEIIEHLIRNYGSKYGEVVKYISENSDWKNPVSEFSPVLKAEIVYAVREEMAIRLADVIRRRTELGSAGYPGDEALTTCAKLMAGELGWTPQKIDDEIVYAKDLYTITKTRVKEKGK